jgi:hypothetical protein
MPEQPECTFSVHEDCEGIFNNAGDQKIHF